MTDIVHLMQSQSLKLAPFFNSVIIYFAFVRDGPGNVISTILKCAPIIFLMFYVILKGFQLNKDYKCSQRILLGLIFSCAGDALLNADLFPHGMGAFALAQICYISAFGWKPLKPFIGIVLYAFGIAMYIVLFKKLDEILIFGVPVYASLLLTMCWRSIANAVDKKDSIHILCAIGSVLFVASDSLIIVSMFLTQIPYSRVLIMATYYAAQLAITLKTSPENPSTIKKSHRRRD